MLGALVRMIGGACAVWRQFSGFFFAVLCSQHTFWFAVGRFNLLLEQSNNGTDRRLLCVSEEVDGPLAALDGRDHHHQIADLELPRPFLGGKES